MDNVLAQLPSYREIRAFQQKFEDLGAIGAIWPVRCNMQRRVPGTLLDIWIRTGIEQDLDSVEALPVSSHM
jgi:hypothetical protein